MVKIAGWQNWPVVETDCEGVSLLLSSAAAAADIQGKKPAAFFESAAAADVQGKKPAAFLESAAAADIHGKKPAALYESAAAADVHSKKSAEFLHHFSVPRNSPPC